MSRPTWDEIWISVAESIKWRSLCSTAKVGAVITDSDNRVVSTGYNGPPAGFEHDDMPCSYWCPRGRDDAPLDSCVSVHAEANAIISGNRSTWQGGTLYVIKHPCMNCAKLIANSGLARIVVAPNPPVLAEARHIEVYSFLAQCGIEVELIPPEMPARVLRLETDDRKH